MFDVFLALVRYGLGGRQGPGTQFVSWIHEADFVRAIEVLIAREEFTGVVMHGAFASACLRQDG